MNKGSSLTWNPVCLMTRVIKSWNVFMNSERSFNIIAAAAATLGSHWMSLLTDRGGVATVIRTEKTNGARFLNSIQIFSKDNSVILSTSHFLRIDGFLKDTNEQHSTEISLRTILSNSPLSSLINLRSSWGHVFPCSSKKSFSQWMKLFLQ